MGLGKRLFVLEVKHGKWSVYRCSQWAIQLSSDKRGKKASTYYIT